MKDRGRGGKKNFFKKFSFPPQKNIKISKKFARKKVNRLFFAYIVNVKCCEKQEEAKGEEKNDTERDNRRDSIQK